jgi:amino acid transporter
MSKKPQPLISIIPYPAKRVLGGFILVDLLVIISIIIINRINGPSDFTYQHLRTTGVLLLLFLQFYIFSAEKAEDERIELIRHKTFFNIIHFAFVLIIIQFIMKLSNSNFAVELNYSSVYLFTLSIQISYIIYFKINLKKDPEWIYKYKSKKESINQRKLIIGILIAIILYYLIIYIYKLVLPELSNLLEHVL